MGSWVDHVIWWQVFPLGFVGAESELAGARPEPHRLRRLIGWLDHLLSLGCNGLLLGPVFTSGTHGYDTIDYLSIDPRLGTDEDFDALIAACRERGIRVLLDGVFNHAGREFPPVKQALAEGPGSAAADWVTLYDTAGVITAEYFEGHDQLVTLNHDSPVVREFIGDVMLHWLDRGIDGWRLDAAYAVPAHFWAAVLPRVRERFGEAWFVGEMIHGNYADYVAAAGLDSVTQYELWKAIWSSLREVNLWELDWTLGRHRDLLTHLVPMTFISNHDVTRVASQIAEPEHVPHAVVLLCFLPGIPSIYYGDEFGLEALKENRAGGDDAVRPEFPAERWAFPGGHPEIERLYRRMIGLRRRQPWLTDAVIATSAVSERRMIITAQDRSSADRRLILVLNLASEPYKIPALTGEVVESGAAVTPGEVPPHSWLILSG